MEKKLKTATLCVRGGWKPKNGEPVQPPIGQSTTFKYDASDEMGMHFDLKKKGYSYTRLQSPPTATVAAPPESGGGFSVGSVERRGSEPLPPGGRGRRVFPFP